MKCEKCGFDDLGTGDSAHLCGRGAFFNAATVMQIAAVNPSVLPEWIAQPFAWAYCWPDGGKPDIRLDRLSAERRDELAKIGVTELRLYDHATVTHNAKVTGAPLLARPG